MHILLRSKAPGILSRLSQGSHKRGVHNLNVGGADYCPNVVQFLDTCDSVWCKTVRTVHCVQPAQCLGN
jgi:hypothetical protein